MSSLLRLLFDFQRFDAHPPLTKLIEETERRADTSAFSVPDETLSQVSAAGEKPAPHIPKIFCFLKWKSED
ncbi:MAG: hypothetical protein KBS45_01030 [Clostridiales bacterium]|nr:hypothetical protein [Candidatus Coliplasma caballi]